MLKDIYNKPIANLELTFSDINKISNLNLLEKDGSTNIILNIRDNQKVITFKLNKNRKVDRNSLNTLKKDGILTQIS